MSFDVYRIHDSADMTCIVVGLGLIGKAVQRILCSEGQKALEDSDTAFDWDKPDSVIQKIEPYLLANDSQVELIWCAGKSGFFATDSELQREFEVFQETLEKLSKSDMHIGISFLSSAGGLYEGAGGAASAQDAMSPIRPYGDWKIKQEEYLSESRLCSRIYRISTVYGSMAINSRRGILNALFESAYLNRPATIYAKGSTLRDYVSNLDVARYIVANLTDKHDSVNILASGRPASIHMLVNMVSRVTHKNPRVIFSCETNNDTDIVFSPDAIADGFKCQSIEEGILRMASQYKNFMYQRAF